LVCFLFFATEPFIVAAFGGSLGYFFAKKHKKRGGSNKWGTYDDDYYYEKGLRGDNTGKNPAWDEAIRQLEEKYGRLTRKQLDALKEITHGTAKNLDNKEAIEKIIKAAKELLGFGEGEEDDGDETDDD